MHKDHCGYPDIHRLVEPAGQLFRARYGYDWRANRATHRMRLTSMRTQKPFFRDLIRPFGTLRGLVRGVVRDTGGVAAIEFGIMIPLFALMAVSVTDIGLAVYHKMQVE